MKKTISIILAVVMTAMVAMPVFADVTTTKDASENMWTTAGTDAAYANKMMTIVAYSGDEITIDSIQYIDQTTADVNGAFAFEDYIPKNLPTSGNYKVKVGSEDLSTPVDAGIIEQIQISSGTVSGTVVTASDTATATVDFYTAGTSTLIDSATTEAGAFSKEVEAGTYDIVISRPGYLKYTLKNVTVEEAYAVGNITLLAGDIDSNNIVNTDDLTPIISAFGAQKAEAGDYNVAYDIDANNTINTDDLTPVISNFTETATVIDVSAQG